MTGKYTTKICNFLGAISYPLYITHYPLIYLHMAWVINNKNTDGHRSLLGGLVVLAASITIAYVSLKLYDEPVRNWLKKALPDDEGRVGRDILKKP